MRPHPAADVTLPWGFGRACRSLKILTAPRLRDRHAGLVPILGIARTPTVKTKTCAACDCVLDHRAIRVTIGGDPVDVCCEACAERLKEAHAAARDRKD